MCVCRAPQKTREKLTTDIPETDFGVISNGFFIFSVSYIFLTKKSNKHTPGKGPYIGLCRASRSSLNPPGPPQKKKKLQYRTLFFHKMALYIGTCVYIPPEKDPI